VSNCNPFVAQEATHQCVIARGERGEHMKYAVVLASHGLEEVGIGNAR
jgi:hypothetical protein